MGVVPVARVEPERAVEPWPLRLCRSGDDKISAFPFLCRGEAVRLGPHPQGDPGREVVCVDTRRGVLRP